ncbi:MAG: CHAD domain-containing protein [Acidobacteriaceae bacterium]
MAFDLGRIQKDIRRLRSFLRRWPKHAPPEQVHSLRTTIRRFEAAVQALALDSNANEKRLLRKLAKLRRRAGKVRDLDVLTGYIAGLKTGEEEDCVVQLLEYLGAEHADRSQRLASFAVKHGESLRRRLKQTATDLNAFSEESVVTSTAPGHAMLSELRLQRELTKPVRLTRNNLHPYRLQVKELRYMLEMENNPADQALIETLGQVKDAIGEWHDWQQLGIIARDHLPHGSKCKLISLLQKTTQKKLKAAIARANAGRQQIRHSPARTKDNA